MKYLFFSFITLTFCSHSQPGNTPTKKKCYEDSIDFEGYIVSDCGRKKGVTSFDDKLIVEPGTNIILWKHNQQTFTGECESCNPINEKTQFRFKVENGNINGAYTRNYPSGCIQERGNKVMGQFDGQIELFYDTTNAPHEIANYILGKLDGPQLELTPKGDTIAFQNYKVISKGDKIESILHGVQKLYYSNGKIESEVNYNLGQLDGDYKKYSKQGILLNDRKFRKGKENGRCISYYDDGKKLLEENWKDGVKEGAFILYTPNDSIKSQEFYKKGLPEGTFIEYFDNRQMQSKVVYSKGKKINEQYWNEYGQDITEERKKELDKDKPNQTKGSKKSEEQESIEEKKSGNKPEKEKNKKESKRKKEKSSKENKEEEEF
jgi:antitoxin component YwqK of YwqJK toxin-antitoxin module